MTGLGRLTWYSKFGVRASFAPAQYSSREPYEHRRMRTPPLLGLPRRSAARARPALRAAAVSARIETQATYTTNDGSYARNVRSTNCVSRSFERYINVLEMTVWTSLMDRPSQTDAVLLCVPWPACRRERYHWSGCVAVAAMSVAKAAQTVTKPDDASNVEADAPRNNPSYKVWRSVGKSTSTVFGRIPAHGQHHRRFLSATEGKADKPPCNLVTATQSGFVARTFRAPATNVSKNVLAPCRAWPPL